MRSAFLKKLAGASLVAAAMLLVTAQSAFATHFRYGTIAYSQDPGNPRLVTYTITTSWRRTFFTSSGITVNVGSFISPSVTGYTFNFGDGTTAAMGFTVTSVDPTNDWFTAVTTLTHLYGSNTTYTPFFINCCRLSPVSATNPNGLQENGDTSWYLWTKVNTAALNHPPSASVPPIVTLAAGFADANFQISATDIDGDNLNYRLATPAEMCGAGISGATCTSPTTGSVTQPPGLTVDGTGTVHFDTRAPRASGQTWNAQIVVSDATTSTVVDFLIRLITQTSQPPVTQINTSAAPYSISVLPGTPVSFTVTGTDPDAGATVTLSASGVPAGATFTPTLPTTGAAPRSATFNWTPTLANAGLSYNFNLITTDNTGLTDFNSASIQVLANLKPVVGCPSSPTIVNIDPATGLADVSVSLPIDDADDDAVDIAWRLAVAPFTVFEEVTTPPANNITATLQHAFPLGVHMTQFVITDNVSGGLLCPLTVDVRKAEQTITFDDIADQIYGAGPLTLTGSATSNLPLSFALISGAASIADDQLTITGIGTITVEASQAGNEFYAPALSVIHSFVVSEATPSLSIAGGTFTYDGVGHPATGTATGAFEEDLGPLSFTYNGSPDVPVNAGIYTVEASYPGSANYTPASATTTLEITKADSTVTVGGGTFTYDATPHAVSGSATGVGGVDLGPVTITYNGSADAPVDAGTYNVLATFGGDANHDGSSATNIVEIGKADPTVSVGGGTFAFDGTAHPVTGSATGIGGTDLGTVTITYNGSPDAPVNAGTYNAVAAFSGNANYNSGSATSTVEIGKIDPTVVVGSANVTYDGAAHGVTGSATGIGGVDLGSVTITYNGSSDAPVNAGSYAVLASFAGDLNYNPATASGVVDIAKATPIVTAAGGSFNYDGLPHPATASATGVGGASLGPVVVTYNGSPAAPVSGGNYAVLASYAGDLNYNNGNASSTVIINAVPLTITADDKSKIAGEANPDLTVSYAGLVSGDAFNPVVTTTATTASPAGTYPITVTPFTSPNYSITFVDGTLTVNPARQLCLDYDATRAHTSGSDIPVRLRLCDMSGNNISSPSFVLTAASVSLGAGGSAPAQDAGGANPGNVFRLQSAGYMFNLQTTGLPSGTHALVVSVSGDPTTYSVPVIIR